MGAVKPYIACFFLPHESEADGSARLGQLLRHGSSRLSRRLSCGQIWETMAHNNHDVWTGRLLSPLCLRSLLALHISGSHPAGGMLDLSTGSVCYGSRFAS